jgi:hypothetical protein
MQLTLQFVGALGILVPFALLQLRRTTTQSWRYQALNLAGAGLLTWLALIESQPGVVILQGVWALAALAGLVHAIGSRPHPATQPDSADLQAPDRDVS